MVFLVRETAGPGDFNLDTDWPLYLFAKEYFAFSFVLTDPVSNFNTGVVLIYGEPYLAATVLVFFKSI